MKMNQVLAFAMEIGEWMLISGAGVARVEDTINRICKAYGARETNVFSITTSIVTTVQNENGDMITQTKRIRRYQTDFKKLDELNTLSRFMCEQLPEAEEVRERLKVIEEGEICSMKKQVVISALIAGAFAVFFGGGTAEGMTAFITGGLVVVLGNYMKKLMANTMFINFVSSFFVASIAWLSAKSGFAIDYGTVIIGNIMLLVPGVAFVNSLRDMIGGDMMSGILKVCESILLAIFLAGGSFAALVFWGGVF